MAKDLADRSGLAFLNAELRTGLTLSRIALSAIHQDKRERNRINARKAYDAILHYLPEANLSAREAEEIETRLAELRSELQLLGEKI
jgi:hypothetical protein